MRNASHRFWPCGAAMRRFTLAAALAALGAAVLASPAFAFAPHFNVVSGKGTIKQVGPHLFQNKKGLSTPTTAMTRSAASAVRAGRSLGTSSAISSFT